MILRRERERKREKERDNRMTMKPTRYFLVKVDNSVYV